MEFKASETGKRLDVSILEASDGKYTRSYFSGLISAGNVTVNGKVITKNGYKLTEGDEVAVDIPAPVDTDTRPEDIPLDIVYEDDDLLIINKPQGMVVHPACGHHEGTLVNALLAHCNGKLSDINGVIRPGIVHRIDKDTSGLMVAVKNNETHIKMAKMIADHDVKRQYRALVYGVISHDKGTVDAPIAHNEGEGDPNVDPGSMYSEFDGMDDNIDFPDPSDIEQAEDASPSDTYQSEGEGELRDPFC
jgi:23S rRNA pseudouridine1911/1915/1917 synthase